MTFWIFQRVSSLSKLKDLTEVKFEELNIELSRLPIVAESRDSWKSPRVENAVILSAYLESRPEVVLEEDSKLQRGNHAWAMVPVVRSKHMRFVKSLSFS